MYTVIRICERLECNNQAQKLHAWYCSAFCRCADLRVKRKERTKKPKEAKPTRTCKREGCERQILNRPVSLYCTTKCRKLDTVGEEFITVPRKRGRPRKDDPGITKLVKYCDNPHCGKQLTSKWALKYCCAKCRNFHAKIVLPETTTKPKQTKVEVKNDFPCIGCIRCTVNNASDSGYECSAGLFVVCKPYRERSKYEPKN